MSDDEYEYDYDYDFLSEDETANDIADHVDSLAEHTLHSPVLVNANPDFEVEYDDWEYLTDEYYDGNEETVQVEDLNAKAANGKRKRGAGGVKNGAIKHKRRKADEQEEGFKPIVLWRSKDTDVPIPLLDIGKAKKVALLVDWRQLLKEEKPAALDDSPVDVSIPLTKSKEKPLKAKSTVEPSAEGKTAMLRRGKRPREEEVSDVGEVGTAPATRSKKTRKK